MNRLLCFALLTMLPAAGRCADKALIIAIGNFANGCAPNSEPTAQNPCIPNLPGIDKDANRIHQLALDMGFGPGQIHTLQDQQGTLTAITSELNGWLHEGVGPQDRVLIYFSTHGSRKAGGVNGPIGVIATYDIRMVVAAGQMNFVNDLTGPALAHSIETNPSRNVLLIVDACQSAGLTTDKSLKKSYASRFLWYPGIPDDSPGGNVLKGAFLNKSGAQGANYAYLAAAAREESAVGDGDGGFMTAGVDQGLRSLASRHQTASISGAFPIVLDVIHAKASKSRAPEQHPEVYGDPRLLNADWFTRQETSGAWDALENLLRYSSGSLQITGIQASYRKGDASMNITVTVPRAGYLFILSIGEGDGKITQLFPNQMDPQNQIAAGTVSIPKPGALKDWHIRQGLADGITQQKVLLVAMLSDNPDIFKDLSSGSGPFKDVLLPVETTRSPFPEEGATGYLAAGVTYVIEGRP